MNQRLRITWGLTFYRNLFLLYKEKDLLSHYNTGPSILKHACMQNVLFISLKDQNQHPKLLNLITLTISLLSSTHLGRLLSRYIFINHIHNLHHIDGFNSFIIAPAAAAAAGCSEFWSFFD